MAAADVMSSFYGTLAETETKTLSILDQVIVETETIQIQKKTRKEIGERLSMDIDNSVTKELFKTPIFDPRNMTYDYKALGISFERPPWRDYETRVCPICNGLDPDCPIKRW